MRRIALILSVFLPLLVKAQSGFVLSADAYISKSGVNLSRSKYTFIGDPKPITGNSVGMKLSYCDHHIVLKFGLEYLECGYKHSYTYQNLILMNSIYYNYYIPQNGVPGQLYGTPLITEIFSIIRMPLSIGYRINIGKRFFVIPSLGLDLTYNLQDKIKDDSYGSVEVLKGENYYSAYTRMNIWATTGLEAGVNLSKHIGVIIGGSMRCMLNSIAKDNSSSQNLGVNKLYLSDRGAYTGLIYKFR